MEIEEVVATDDANDTTDTAAGGFVVSVFEVPNDGMMTRDGVPSQAFLEREEEFDIVHVPYREIDEIANADVDSDDKNGKSNQRMGIICARSTDEEYIRRWGQARFDDNYGRYGVSTVWGWTPHSGLRPCAVYLRHCYLAAQSMGAVCLDSFFDETYLIDRTTTIRHYLEQYPEVLDTVPPPTLAERYNG